MPITRAARAAGSGLALVVCVLTTPFLTGPAAASSVRNTYVVQGVPGTAVDVTVDGTTVRSGVASKQVVGPLDLAAGRHVVKFKTADWTVSRAVQVGPSSQDVVLHWPADAAGKPVVTVFHNDLKPVAATKGRITVAHTAVVPPADIVADGKTLFTNIANGEFVTADVPADTYRVSVVPTGGGHALLGPLPLPVQAGVLTRVFAIGAPRDNSMDAIVQVLPLSSSAGGRVQSVHAGSAGLAGTVAPTYGSGPWHATLALGGLLLLAGGVVIWRRHDTA